MINSTTRLGATIPIRAHQAVGVPSSLESCSSNARPGEGAQPRSCNGYDPFDPGRGDRRAGLSSLLIVAYRPSGSRLSSAPGRADGGAQRVEPAAVRVVGIDEDDRLPGAVRTRVGEGEVAGGLAFVASGVSKP